MTDIGIEHNQVTHISGIILEPSDVERGEKSSRTVIDTFHYEVDELLITSGGGANMPLIRKYWLKRLGNPPKTMIQGVPDSTDGHLIQVTEDAGANIVNKDRMWHYTEGIQNHSPIWSNHGIRIIPGPSSMWFDATGKRMAAPDYPDLIHCIR